MILTIDLTNILDRIVLSEHKKWRFRASRFQNFLVDPTPHSPLATRAFSAREIRRYLKISRFYLLTNKGQTKVGQSEWWWFFYVLFFLQSCIGILASLILMFFALTRQDARLWDQLKSLFTKRIFGTCREKIYNIRNKNKINPLGDQLRLQTVGRGNA